MIDLMHTAKGLDDALAAVAGRGPTTADDAGSPAADHASAPELPLAGEMLLALRDIAEGAHTLLELHYLRRVERAHGLPTGRRQRLVRRGKRVEYRDVEYLEFGVHFELDGRLGHAEIDNQWRDLRRDNLAVVDAELRLRYGWVDVLARPCEVAGQVVPVLRRQGWEGPATPYGPDCRLLLP